MKIIYIYNIFDQIGGIERVLTDKMNYLAEKMNHEVILITYMQGSNPFPFPLSKKINLIDIGYNQYSPYKYHFFKQEFITYKINTFFKNSLINILKKENADIIICNSYDLKGIQIVSQIKIKSVKIIESHIARNFINYPIYRKLPHLILHFLEFYQFKRLNLAIKKFDAIITLTQRDALLWSHLAPTYVIPDIITLYPPKSSLCLNKKVIAVGRISEQKGFDLLIKAWQEVNLKHPDWSLNIYGDDTTDKELKEKLIVQINKSKLDKVISIHPVTNNIYNEYLKSSIYILSSRFEGFALVIIEAMACGLPCIAFDCPFGPKEIIKDRKNGILVRYLDVKELAEQINYLIENEQIRRRMGEEARKSAKAYMKDNIMPKWIDLFNELRSKKQHI